MSRNLILALFVVLAASALYFLMREPEAATPGAAGFDAALLQQQLDELRDEQKGLDARLQRLEQAATIERQQIPVAPHHEIDAAAPPPDLETRLASLERAVAGLRSTELAIGEMPTTVAGIVQALADKNLHGWGIAPERMQRRMELRRRLIELSPEDPRAGKELLELAGDYVVAHGAARAIALLDEFAARVHVPARDLTLRYADLYSQSGDGDRARQLYDRVVRDASVTESDRANARFLHAYSYFQQGRYDEAASGFEALILAYGDEPPAAVKGTVAGARIHLAKCREYK